MAEYPIKAGTGTTVDLSRLFLYKEARSQMQVRGDTGAYIRNTIQALATMGSPPEREWPHDIRLFDVEPTGRLYAYAANFKAVEYKRIDTYNNDPEDSSCSPNWSWPQDFLVLGFPVYTSIEEVTAEQWVIPIPGWSQETAQKIDHDQLSGGHAVLVVGYDKNIPVKGPAGTTQGAFIIRNSWGEQWGDQGLPICPFTMWPGNSPSTSGRSFPIPGSTKRSSTRPRLSDKSSIPPTCRREDSSSLSLS